MREKKAKAKTSGKVKTKPETKAKGKEKLKKEKVAKGKQLDVQALRKSLGINQSDFWKAVGSTQSGGSRYETGRKMPKATEILVRVAYNGEKIDDLLKR